MTTNQLRKLNVIVQKKMMTVDQLRLLVSLFVTPTTTLEELTNVYYGVQKDGSKNTMRINYIKKYLKALMLKLDYWGLPLIIVVTKEGRVTLREKAEVDA